MTSKFNPISPTTLGNLKLYSKLSDAIFINKDRIFCFSGGGGAFYEKDVNNKSYQDEFFKCHLKLEEHLDEELSPFLIKVDIAKFVELLDKFNSPEMRVGKNKIEVKEKNKKKVIFKDFKTHFKQKIKYKDAYEIGKEIQIPPIPEIIEPEYQTSLNIEDLKSINSFIDLMGQKKGKFINGNPTKTQAVFKKEKRKQKLVIEDRNHMIMSMEKEITAVSTKKDFQYAFCYKVIREIPHEEYLIQMDSKIYLSEWICQGRSFKISIDMFKTSYAKN